MDSLVWSPLVPDRSILAGELAGWAGLPPVGLSGCPDTSMSTLRAVESEITKLERLDGIKYVEKKNKHINYSDGDVAKLTQSKLISFLSYI